jgi:hypothetical protein
VPVLTCSTQSTSSLGATLGVWFIKLKQASRESSLRPAAHVSWLDTLCNEVPSLSYSSPNTLPEIHVAIVVVATEEVIIVGIAIAVTRVAVVDVTRVTTFDL